ncbi:hypothetical protein ACFO5R_04410 [Halosolutus amylolyticus]|uniref:Halobacterial output domain-containing protein n=1 Tax=Halosolutus amylolyticus TaxID=2932267 RepID=A0ABD5PKP7_9EURY|nr:hypothetical protein [Halosolutus amylolyticus]
MSDENRAPTTAPEWDELVADASAIADEYRENGWDAVVLDPEAVDPVADDDRAGMHVTVSPDEYDLVESLVESDGGGFESANVYYLPADGADRRFAIAVERDETTETAVIVPLTYSISAARSVLERALYEEELLVHVRPDSAAEWIVFSHEDPSLFVEESDVRA